MIRRPPRSTLFPTRRSSDLVADAGGRKAVARLGDDFPFHHVSREREALTSRAAHAAGLSPRVIHDEPGVLVRSEEHTSELQSHVNLVCRLLLEKKKNQKR